MATSVPGKPQVSVIIPARNEETSLGACLESLIAQTGVLIEIIVVNDHSTDRTREVAASFPAVRVIDAGPLLPGWVGKNNAVSTGASESRGEWILFTDADTVHLPGSLARALHEAQEHAAGLLSYSPQQIAVTFWEMATLPVVFAELAYQFPTEKVSDPASPIAAANGQYILIKREVYDQVGGHAAFADNILEDVALARAVKAAGHVIRFRYASDAVRTRMYRSFRQLCEGWTKNLALLFPNPGRLAAKILFLWALPWVLLFTPVFAQLVASHVAYSPSLSGVHHWLVGIAGSVHHWWWAAFVILAGSRNFVRIRRANFDLRMEFLGAGFGMPMFAYLLLRSKKAHDHGTVSWKGRTYTPKEAPPEKPAGQHFISAGKLL